AGRPRRCPGSRCYSTRCPCRLPRVRLPRPPWGRPVRCSGFLAPSPFAGEGEESNGPAWWGRQVRCLPHRGEGGVPLLSIVSGGPPGKPVELSQRPVVSCLELKRPFRWIEIRCNLSSCVCDSRYRETSTDVPADPGRSVVNSLRELRRGRPTPGAGWPRPRRGEKVPGWPALRSL